jgi:tetratricopeptide (TPR) repeat protein
MCRLEKARTAAGQRMISSVLLFAFLGFSPLSAQQAQTSGAQSPAVNATGNVTIIYQGISIEEFEKARAGDKKQIEELSGRLNVSEGAILRFLHSIDEANVPREQWPEKLSEVAEQFHKLQQQVAKFDPQNPAVQGLVKEAQNEIIAGNFSKAYDLLRRARQTQLDSAKATQALANQRFLQAAESSAIAGGLALTELHYRHAAELFKEAADTVPPGIEYNPKRNGYLGAEGYALYRQGSEFGDKDALIEAIEKRKQLIELTPRERALDWGQQQANLGNALSVLGERESGTARLEEALSVYREALKELTRERASLDWAQAQNNVGVILLSLGERESSVAKLEESVVAFRAALEERTRERVSLDWAQTKNNLGNALQRLGARTGDIDKLEQAAETYREALTVLTRENIPTQWAMTLNNLGNVLEALGGRERGIAKLEQAEAAYQEAMTVFTRERFPLLWAHAQNNLGVALKLIGQRVEGTNDLEASVVAFHEALKELTRERVPFEWATTQTGLGQTLMTLGGRQSSTVRLEEAIAAFQEALQELTRERAPLQWANLQNSLGIALQRLGERESGTARLEEAVAVYHDVLTIYARERNPLQWAASGNQAVALMHIARRKRDADMAETAMNQLREARDFYLAAGDVHAQYYGDQFEIAQSVLKELQSTQSIPGGRRAK